MTASAEAAPARRGDHRFPREARVRRRYEFLRIQRQGRRVHSRHFVVVLRPAEPPPGAPRAATGSSAGPTRLGITVTKKVGNAVARNRTKRRVREVFRRCPRLFPTGFDVVVIAKQGAPGLGYSEVRDELAALRGAMRSAARRAAGGRRGAEPATTAQQGEAPEREAKDAPGSARA
ncbi:MAG: ribonuclease P protein component [Sandaracinaceae bacterium]